MCTSNMDIQQLEAILSDPERKRQFLETLPSQLEYIGDRDGDKITVLSIKHLTVPAIFLDPPPPMAAAGIRVRDVSRMPLRDDDIIVATYPKTGTHWVCNMLKFLLTPGPLTDQTSFDPPIVDFFPPEVFELMPSPRILPTHMPPSLIPRDVNSGKGRVLLLYRNPKDVAVSYYYHTIRMNAGEYSKTLTWDCFVGAFMEGLFPPGDYFNFYNGWETLMADQKQLRVLPVCYEDVIQDPMNQLKRISDFLRLPCSEETLRGVVDRSSIEKLRADVSSGRTPSFNIDRSSGESVIYRKGTVGDWKSHFTVAQNDCMDVLIGEKFAHSVFRLQF